jgi:acetophenone carboxylase
VAIDPDSPIGEHLPAETERLRAAERSARAQRGASWEEFQADWQELRPPEEILFAFGSWPDGVVQQPVMRM